VLEDEVTVTRVVEEVVVVALIVEGPVDEDVEDEVVEDEVVEDEVVEITELLVLDTVEHDVVHADAVPTSITSCHPPSDQNVRIDVVDPVVVGVKVSVIVVLPAAAIVAPFAGKPVAVNALPTTTGLEVVVTFVYGAL
jgi:hypothetical protein